MDYIYGPVGMEETKMRWKHREWAKLIFMTLKHNTAGRDTRRRAIRRIGAVLIKLSQDAHSRGVIEQRWMERQRTLREARRRIRNILWGIYIRSAERERLRQLRPLEWVGAIETWVDNAHYVEIGTGDESCMQ